LQRASQAIELDDDDDVEFLHNSQPASASALPRRLASISAAGAAKIAGATSNQVSNCPQLHSYLSIVLSTGIQIVVLRQTPSTEMLKGFTATAWWQIQGH
jgi:hypothetical protein